MYPDRTHHDYKRWNTRKLTVLLFACAWSVGIHNQNFPKLTHCFLDAFRGHPTVTSTSSFPWRCPAFPELRSITKIIRQRRARRGSAVTRAHLT